MIGEKNIMKKKAREIVEKNISKYYWMCGILGVVLVIFFLSLFFVAQNYITIVLCLLFILFIGIIGVRVIANKTLFSVLYKELDAVSFKKIIDDERFNASLIYRVNASLLNGNYETTINIAIKQLNNKRIHKKLKLYYLLILSRAYFELRDFEKLKLLVAKYDEYCTEFSIKKKDNLSIWNYYKCFLNSNYDECKSFCDLRNAQFKNNTWDSKLKKVQNDFFYAVACYENSEIEEAELIFSDIIQKAPNLYLSILSKKYIASIQGKKICFEEILPDSNYHFVENRKFKVIRLIKNASLVFVVAVLIILEFIPGRNELSEYDKKLQTALSQQYIDFEVLDYMNVEENGVVKDVVVFVKDESGEIDVGFIMTYDNGASYNVKITEPNIVYGTYVLTSFTGEHSVYLLVSDCYIDGNDDYSTSEFDCSSKKYFVYAKCVK